MSRTFDEFVLLRDYDKVVDLLEAAANMVVTQSLGDSLGRIKQQINFMVKSISTTFQRVGAPKGYQTPWGAEPETTTTPPPIPSGEEMRKQMGGVTPEVGTMNRMRKDPTHSFLSDLEREQGGRRRGMTASSRFVKDQVASHRQRKSGGFFDKLRGLFSHYQPDGIPVLEELEQLLEAEGWKDNLDLKQEFQKLLQMVNQELRNVAKVAYQQGMQASGGSPQFRTSPAVSDLAAMAQKFPVQPATPS